MESSSLGNPAAPVAAASRVSNGKRFLIGSALALAAGAALAQSTGPDVSVATGAFQATKAAVEEIGPLMLGAVGAGIVFKWVIAFLI